MANQDEIVWLHLSDFHIDGNASGWEYRPLFKSLCEDLKSQANELKLQPDLLFITGDLAFGAIERSTLEEQYKDVRKIIKDIRCSFREMLPPESVFIVPGNHDVNRNVITRPNESYLKEIRNSADADEMEREVTSIFNRNTDPNFFFRLNEYKAFVKSSEYSQLLQDDYGEQLVYHKTLTIKGVRIGIAGLNSAWACSGADTEDNILLGLWQVEHMADLLNDLKPDLKIALGHHPLDCLHQKERAIVKRSVEGKYNVYLHGHTHKPGLDRTPGDNHMSVCAYAAYQKSRKAGYNFVRYPIGSTAPPSLILRVYKDGLEGSGWAADAQPGLPGNVVPLKGLPPLKRSLLQASHAVERPVASEQRLSGAVASILSIPQATGEFDEMLQRRMQRLKELFRAKIICVAFLGDRIASAIPDIREQSFRDSGMVRDQLNRQPMRDLHVVRGLTLNPDDKLVAFGEFTPTKDLVARLTSMLTDLHREISPWVEWVTASPVDLLNSPVSGSPLMYPLKYIPSDANRDVFGFLIVDGFEGASSTAEVIQAYIEGELLPLLRSMFLNGVQEQLENAKSRDHVLSIVLGAAVSLAGADWGCIKSACLGAAQLRDNQELVRAECVYHCPRFFHEGRLTETESLVGSAIAADRDRVMDIHGQTRDALSHPAVQIGVWLIHDTSGVVEPIKGTKSTIGALVVQHSSNSYLKDNEHVFGPLLRSLADLIPLAIRSISAAPMLHVLRASLDDSFIRTEAQSIVNAVFYFGNHAWILLRPKDGEFIALHQSDNVRQDLLSVLGILPGAEPRASLVNNACDNRVTLFTRDAFDSNADLVIIKRHNTEHDEAQAYFSDRFKRRVKELEVQKKQRLILNLGERDLFRTIEEAKSDGRQPPAPMALIVAPIISPTGLPVGVLGVALDQNIRWDSAKMFQEKVGTLMEALWALTIKKN